MDIGYMLRRMANDHLEGKYKIAVQEELGRNWTYEELHLISNRYANKLQELGVKKGDRVGILLYNCLEYFGLYFAIAKLGAIAVRLNFRLTSFEYEYALNDSKPKVLIFHSDLIEKIEPIIMKTSIKHFICLADKSFSIPKWCLDFDTLSNGKEQEVLNTIHLQDPVMLMYTSGTTGRPKGAVWTHDTTLWFATIQSLKWKFSGEEVAMTTGPLYHVGAMEDIALPILLMGGTVIITKSKGFEITRILNVVEKKKVSHIFLFPFMIYEMLHLKDLKKDKLKHLQMIFTGGDPLMPWSLETLNKQFPHIGIVQVYGLTEGQPIAASLDPQDSLKKGHTVGKPMPLTEIKIIDDEGNELPPGTVGEIAIKSPAISIGYWRKPEATAQTFVDGWCHTGDLGILDKDGYLTIAGRKKDMIRSGGENIYPVEIEDVLYRHEAIKDVAVIGIPDPKYIETVCAIIVRKEGMEVTEDEIIKFCKRYLASYKKPRKIIFVDSLPRTASGKIQKYVLRNTYGSLQLNKET